MGEGEWGGARGGSPTHPSRTRMHDSDRLSRTRMHDSDRLSRTRMHDSVRTRMHDSDRPSRTRARSELWAVVRPVGGEKVGAWDAGWAG